MKVTVVNNLPDQTGLSPGYGHVLQNLAEKAHEARLVLGLTKDGRAVVLKNNTTLPNPEALELVDYDRLDKKVGPR